MDWNRSGLSPSYDKVVIEPIEVEVTSKGGIVLPEQTRAREQDAVTIGTLVAAGKESANQLAVDGIGVGDKVLFTRYSGHIFPVQGVRFSILKWQNILGKADRLPDYMLTGVENTLGQLDGMKAA